MPDIITIENCPKCGNMHQYELRVTRVSAHLEDRLDKEPSRTIFRTRLFHCPSANEPFQYRFPLTQFSNTEVIEVYVGEILENTDSAHQVRGSPTRVFVSYSRRDQSIVTPIVHIIRAVGLRVFQDIDSTPYGKRWRPVIEKSVKTASVVLVFWSEHAKESSEVRKEWELAVEAGKDIVPTLLDDTPMDPSLAEYQAVDLRSLALRHSGGFNGLDSVPGRFENIPADLRQRLLEVYREKQQAKPDVAALAAARLWLFLEERATR